MQELCELTTRESMEPNTIAFRDNDLEYPQLQTVLPKIYRRRDIGFIVCLKDWFETSPLRRIAGARNAGRVIGKGMK